MAVGRQPMPLPTYPFSTLLSRSLLGWECGGSRFSLQRRPPHCIPSLCVTVTFSTPEAVPFAEEMFSHFIFAEEIWKLEASLQSIGAGVGPPGSNPDRSSD